MKAVEKILETLKQHEKLKIDDVAEKLGLSYDTTARHLKRMYENGLLERVAKGKPWIHYYSIKKQIQLTLD